MAGTFGAMFASVSNLNSQSQALAASSDNVANVKTVGYKTTSTSFKTIVTGSATKESYSPGGNRAINVNNVDSQGLLQNTEYPTDIGIAGQGFFVVAKTVNGSEIGYTRAGEFRRDKTGNLVNSAGFYLQGWATDVKGNVLAPDSKILSSLETVRLNQVAALTRPTTNIVLKGNLDATWKTGYTAATTQLTFSETVYDSLGQSHILNFKFSRDAANAANAVNWNVEITCPDGVVSRPATSATNANANYSAATPMVMNFNTDGTPSSYDGGAVGNGPPQVQVAFTGTPAANLVVNMDYGTPGAIGFGKNDGFTCISGPGKLAFHEQDGLPYGEFESVSIDESGNVAATFDNSQTIVLYKLPLANFPNPNALQPKTGNIYLQTQESGNFNLGKAKTPGRGIIQSNSLEQSKSDIGTEFVNLLITQKVFNASTTVIRMANQMSDQLQNLHGG